MARSRHTHVPSSNRLDQLDPRAKILGSLALVVGIVATPNAALWALAAAAVLVSFLVGVARIPWGALGRRALGLVPVIGLMAGLLLVSRLIPGARSSTASLPGWVTATAVTLKALLSLSIFAVVTERTAFVDLMWGLHALHVPRLLLLVVASTYRWANTLTGELARMRRALAARNYRPCWLGDVPFLGYLLGSLFLRTYSRSERVHLAMVSRGYDGTLPADPTWSGRRGFETRDHVFLATTACAGLAVFLSATLWK